MIKKNIIIISLITLCSCVPKEFFYKKNEIHTYHNKRINYITITEFTQLHNGWYDAESKTNEFILESVHSNQINLLNNALKYGSGKTKLDPFSVFKDGYYYLLEIKIENGRSCCENFLVLKFVNTSFSFVSQIDCPRCRAIIK